MVSAKDIAAFLGTDINGPDIEVCGLAAADNMKKNHMHYSMEPNTPNSEPTPVDALLICPFSTGTPRVSTLIYSTKPRWDFALAARHFFPNTSESAFQDTFQNEKTTADIDQTAVLGRGTIVEHGAQVGAQTTIGYNCVIKANTTIGSNCYIGSNSVIGEQGFGLAYNESGVPTRLPHIGGVIIEDNVEIGAQCVVSRGTFNDTTVGEHTKINDHVHIAHNAIIGRNCTIAGAKISGSVNLGDNVWIAPGVTIQNKVSVGHKSLIGTGSVVVKDIPPGVVAYGHPASPVRDRNGN